MQKSKKICTQGRRPHISKKKKGGEEKIDRGGEGGKKSDPRRKRNFH